MRSLTTWAVLILLLPAPARAGQDADTRDYVLRRGNDTVAVERVTRLADGVHGKRLVNRVGLTEYRIALDAEGRLTGAARESDLAHPGDEFEIAPPPGTRAVTVGGQSVGLLEWLVHQVPSQGRGPSPVPVWRSARQTGDTALVERAGASARVTLGALVVDLRLDTAGRVVGGRFPDHGVEVVPAPGLPDGALRPQHPYAAIGGADYEVHEVRLAGAAGHRLAGSLTLPGTPGRVPAAVLVTGLRANDRNNTGPRAYVPFREIADALTRRGVAVLRLDDRGVGGSEGDHDAATSRDEAEDIAAAVAYLRSRPDIARAVALLGLSEGAVVAPMVAAADSTIAAVVLLGGLGGDAAEALDYSIRYRVERDPAIPAAARDSAIAAQRARALASTPRVRTFYRLRGALATAARIRAPVLIVHGARDRQVPPSHAGRLAGALVDAGNPDVTLRVMPGLSHLLIQDPDGRVSEWASLPALSLAPEVVDLVGEWLADRLDARPAATRRQSEGA